MPADAKAGVSMPADAEAGVSMPADAEAGVKPSGKTTREYEITKPGAWPGSKRRKRKRGGVNYLQFAKLTPPPF
ncbi:hypothetical protein [Zobellella denitrificans]